MFSWQTTVAVLKKGTIGDGRADGLLIFLAKEILGQLRSCQISHLLGEDRVQQPSLQIAGS